MRLTLAFRIILHRTSDDLIEERHEFEECPPEILIEPGVEQRVPKNRRHGHGMCNETEEKVLIQNKLGQRVQIGKQIGQDLKRPTGHEDQTHCDQHLIRPLTFQGHTLSPYRSGYPSFRPGSQGEKDLRIAIPHYQKW